MDLQALGISSKKIEKKFVLYGNFRGEIKDIPSKLEDLYQKYKNYVSKPAIAVIDYGVFSEGGQDIDICFPISKNSEKLKINKKYLEEVEVLSINHYGLYNELGKSAQKLFNYLHTYGVLGTSWIRLIFDKFEEKNQNDNKIEIQAILHGWDEKLATNLERVLDEDVRMNIMKGRDELFTLESTLDEKFQWIKQVLNKLDKIANDYQKYEILSCCAHVFSQKRIDKLKSIYEKNKDIDEVIREMDKDFAWYEGQKRKGNTIFVQKVPYNKEGYEKATTDDEKKKYYCHCPLVKNFLNEKISPTFCNCSAGWYRQYWEGILGKSVRINILKTLIKGDNVCQFEILLS
ncbi:MAG: hypothetical protein ACFE9I_02385 [Candidatus Hermodarchaeota archaeon]